jgi:UrcA family protein
MPRHTNMRTAIPCALLAILTGSLSVAVAADEPGEVAKRTVKFADLDLTRSAGVAALYARITRAAAEVCEPTDIRVLDMVMTPLQCKAQSVERAIAAVNVRALTSYYLAKKERTLRLAQRK